MFAAAEGQRGEIAHVLRPHGRLVPDFVPRRHQQQRAGGRHCAVRQRLPTRVRDRLFRRDGRHRGRLAQTRPRRR